MQASGQELASTPGWNPIAAFAAPSSEWAQGMALAEIAELQKAAAAPDAAAQPNLTTFISLVNLAKEQDQAGDAASQQYFDLLQQFGDCGLGAPTAH